MKDNKDKTKSESELTKMLDSIIDEALKGLNIPEEEKEDKEEN